MSVPEINNNNQLIQYKPDNPNIAILPNGKEMRVVPTLEDLRRVRADRWHERLCQTSLGLLMVVTIFSGLFVKDGWGLGITLPVFEDYIAVVDRQFCSILALTLAFILGGAALFTQHAIGSDWEVEKEWASSSLRWCDTSSILRYFMEFPSVSRGQLERFSTRLLQEKEYCLTDLSLLSQLPLLRNLEELTIRVHVIWPWQQNRIIKSLKELPKLNRLRLRGKNLLFLTKHFNDVTLIYEGEVMHWGKQPSIQEAAMKLSKGREVDIIDLRSMYDWVTFARALPLPLYEYRLHTLKAPMIPAPYRSGRALRWELKWLPKVADVLDQIEDKQVLSSVRRKPSNPMAKEFLYLRRQDLKPLVLYKWWILVYTLDLSGFGLSSLPTKLFDLSFLKHLNLKRNKLMFLQDGFAGLQALESLKLDYNNLASLPSVLQFLPKLKELSASHNEMTTLGPSWTNTSKLEKVALQCNNLSVDNKFDWSKLNRLRFLYLRGNAKVKRLPQSLLNRPTLEYLGLEGTEAKWEVPQQVMQKRTAWWNRFNALKAG